MAPTRNTLNPREHCACGQVKPSPNVPICRDCWKKKKKQQLATSTQRHKPSNLVAGS